MLNKGIPIPVTEITLKHLLSGEMQSLFDEALGKVRQNISDPRTWYKFTRKIHLEFCICPNDDGETATIFCKLNTKLAPVQVGQVVDLTHQQYFTEQGFSGIKGVNNEPK